VKTYDVGSGGVSAFALAWKPDSTTLAVAVYRAVNLYTVQGSDNPTAVAADTIGYSMAFSPDNKYLAVGSGTTSARLYDPGNGYAQIWWVDASVVHELRRPGP